MIMTIGTEAIIKVKYHPVEAARCLNISERGLVKVGYRGRVKFGNWAVRRSGQH